MVSHDMCRRDVHPVSEECKCIFVDSISYSAGRKIYRGVTEHIVVNRDAFNRNTFNLAMFIEKILLFLGIVIFHAQST